LATMCLQALNNSPNALNPNYQAAISGVTLATGPSVIGDIKGDCNAWAKEKGFQ
jgi:hypothetical protein